MSEKKSHRVTYTGNRTEVISSPESSFVTKVQREYRFAYELINISRYHASEAIKTKKNDRWKIRSNVISTIISSHAAVEATYNEFIHIIALGNRSPLNDIKREVIHYIASENLTTEPRQHILKRFNMLLRVLEKEEIKTGSEPYQSANLARILRNMLVHPLPVTVVTFDMSNPDLSTQQDIVQKLQSHLKLDRKATFPDDILVPICATWAVRSAERFLAEFEKNSGVDLEFDLHID